MKTPQEIADMLYGYRVKRNMSREALADDAGIAVETLKFIELNIRNHYPRLATAVKLADAMGITLDEFVQ